MEFDDYFGGEDDQMNFDDDDVQQLERDEQQR
jgi:hypothetical protein